MLQLSQNFGRVLRVLGGKLNQDFRVIPGGPGGLDVFGTFGPIHGGEYAIKIIKVTRVMNIRFYCTLALLFFAASLLNSSYLHAGRRPLPEFIGITQKKEFWVYGRLNCSTHQSSYRVLQDKAPLHEVARFKKFINPIRYKDPVFIDAQLTQVLINALKKEGEDPKNYPLYFKKAEKGLRLSECGRTMVPGAVLGDLWGLRFNENNWEKWQKSLPSSLDLAAENFQENLDEINLEPLVHAANVHVIEEVPLPVIAPASSAAPPPALFKLNQPALPSPKIIKIQLAQKIREENAWDRIKKLPGLTLEAGKTLVNDTVGLFVKPFHASDTDLLTAGVLMGVVGLSMALDEPVRDRFGRPESKTVQKMSDFFTDVGSLRYQAPILLSGIAIGLTDYIWTGDTKLRDATLTGAESAAMASLFATGIKFVVGRSRPKDDKGEFDFHPFGGGKSFPSSHAAAAFALAASLDQYYDSPVPEIAYATATLISLSRITKDSHHLSDIMAGALLGICIGHTIGGFHVLDDPAGKYVFRPAIGPDTAVFEFVIRF